ncbi:Bgt-4360 [Blumeria graminis f. sp. tritici]|uniref:Bgt-4360 n=2 Tax=Blumeria graminis f. sp. tritici TaxID=62690 RepID=A0A381L3X6_BLUGR|nr:hypothetical protein BGT96224_4360 [Blumeria graminis f. sp. tritici 96224]VCU40181.1 Bgt-4360 [Blumeria graminis f. sp. tritici]
MPPVNAANFGPCISTISDGEAAHPQITSYDYNDIADVVTVPTRKRVLIDVRRESELVASGTIPGSLHIPLHLVQEALARTEAGNSGPGLRFPDKDVELVFFCRSGLRSAQAAELAMLAGWNKVGNYVGSWLDWEKRGGKIERIEVDSAAAAEP